MSADSLLRRGGETWFFETPVAGTAFALRVDRVIHEATDGLQQVLVFEHEHLGRVLALDGIVQVCEADEHIYHEMMAHTPLIVHGAAERVLIIGGGDGGVAREALRHTSIRDLTLVEIDRSVVDLSRQWMPDISAGAFEDPRLELIIADGADFMRNREAAYDVIIVDSTDPDGPGAVLFTETFYTSCARALRSGGVMISQNGVPFLQREAVARAFASLRAAFPHVHELEISVPTYAGGPMALGLSTHSQAKADAATSIASAARTWAAADLPAQYYTPDRQISSIRNGRQRR